MHLAKYKVLGTELGALFKYQVLYHLIRYGLI